MKGKNRCKILKEIRQAIADENGIDYVTTECKHKGDCAGTCPKCEQEVRYLEEELKKKQSLGKKIAVVGVAASVALSGVGCDDILQQSTDGDITAPNEPFCTDVSSSVDWNGDLVIEGYIQDCPESEETSSEKEPQNGVSEIELLGDIAY